MKIIRILQNKWRTATKVRKIVYLAILFLVIDMIGSIMIYINLNKENKEENTIHYAKFLKLVDQHRVESITKNNYTITFKLKNDDTVYYTDNPESASFKENMLLKGVEFNTIVDQNDIAMIFNLLFFLIFVPTTVFFMFILTRKITGGGKHSIVVERPTVNFDNVAGMEELKEDLLMIEKVACNRKNYNVDVKIPKGILLEGPPGNGKTLLAKAFAGQSKMNFIAINASSVGGIYAGLGASQIEKVFKLANKNKPCVIFIDEIDSIAGKRSNESTGVSKDDNKTVNALLNAMDGFNEMSDIIVMAATNRSDFLDEAIMRPGRFDRKLFVSKPDFKTRKELISMCSKRINFNQEINSETLARDFIGLSCAAITTIVNEATISMIKDENSEIEQKYIDNAFIELISKGKIKREPQRSKEDEITIAHHEAGHALASMILFHKIPSMISVVETTSKVGGFTLEDSLSDKELTTIKDIENRIMVLYSGRASELLLRCSYASKSDLMSFINETSIGCINDVTEATNLVKTLLSFEKVPVDKTLFKTYDNELKDASDLAENLWIKTLDMLKKNEKNLYTLAELISSNGIVHESDLKEFYNNL